MIANSINDINDFVSLQTSQVKEMVKQYQWDPGATIRNKDIE